MKRPLCFLLLLPVLASLLTSCGTFSTDPAPGGIRASETGMSVQSVQDWQDRTIRRLAY